MSTNAPHDRPTLDYATPPSHEPPGQESTRPVASEWRASLAGVFGVVAGLFGGLMLFVGVPGIHWLLTSDRADSGDVFSVAMFNGIGLVGLYVAFRWLRFAFRNPSRPPRS